VQKSEAATLGLNCILSVVDPRVYLAEQFETGGSPRIGYSNPKLDALLSQERATFDPAKRKKVLSEAMSLITEEAPAHFLWRHQFLYDIARNVEFRPRPNGRIFAEDISVLR
jgi:peptide/nickel transport system substrate-binding protein